MGRRVRVQTARKRFSGKCFFCPCSDYEALQCHRIVPGADGGEYVFENTLCLCATCHCKVTAGTIKVFARRYGTSGSYIHCILDGKEQFIRE